MKQLLEILVPVIVGALTTLFVQGLKAVLGVLDRAPAYIKQVVVVVVAFLLAKLAAFTHVPLPADLAGLDATTVSTLLSSLIAMAIHAGVKSDQVKPAGVASGAR